MLLPIAVFDPDRLAFLEFVDGLADPVELIDAGDQVVAVAQVNGVGPASQIAMDDRDRFAFLFTIKNGRVVREQAFRNREEAVEAAGLSE
jgi:ketosteroid isomerase-like protein